MDLLSAKRGVGLKRALWEPLLLAAGLLGLFKLTQLFLPPDWTALLVPALLLYAPFTFSDFRRSRLLFIDRSLAGFLNGWKWFFLVTLILIPPFMGAAHFWMVHVSHYQTFSAAPFRFFTEVCFAQLIAVALPEEFFFRGYFQGRLNTFFKPRWNILGVRLGYDWLLTAVIFAFAHSVIQVQWWHFSIFFPALVFGWLREKTGSITAPILFHTFCNCWTTWFVRSYL